MGAGSIIAFNEDGKVTVAVWGWKSEDGYITQTSTANEIEGYGVYRREGGVMVHVQDFETLRAAMSYAEMAAALYGRIHTYSHSLLTGAH